MESVYTRRLAALQERMAEEALDLCVYGPSPDFQYLTGLASGWRGAVEWESGLAHLFVPQSGRAVLAAEPGRPPAEGWPGAVRPLDAGAPRADSLAAILEECAPAPVRVGLGRFPGGVVPLVRALGRSGRMPDLAETGGLLDAARRIKGPEEIALLEKAAALTDRVMERIVPLIREGVTSRDLEIEIDFQGRLLGAQGVSFGPAALFVRSGGAPTGDPFVHPRDAGLQPGTSVAFDFGFVLDGYSSDYGRSFYFGRPTAEISGAYRALQTAQTDLIGRIRPGETALGDFFPLLEKTLDRLGYGDALRARLSTGVLGHQIGIEVHEDPWIAPGCGTPAAPGLVMALEPKLLRTGDYYLRVEDMVLVEAAGARSLTRFDRALFAL